MASASEILVGAGVSCLIGAAIGGGLQAAGVTLPLISSHVRQALLAIMGVVFIWMGIVLEPQRSSPAEVASGRKNDFNSQMGFVYYGRKDNGDPSDGGKLRPADGRPLPLSDAIRAGDVFKGVDVKQLRKQPFSASDQLALLPIGTCYRTIDVVNIQDWPDGRGEGAWLQVETAECPD